MLKYDENYLESHKFDSIKKALNKNDNDNDHRLIYIYIHMVTDIKSLK